MIHWSVRNVQVRSRHLNEQIILKLHEAHVIFVQMTEIQEQARRGQLTEDEAKQSLDLAISSHANAMEICNQLLAERTKLFEPFSKKD